MKKSISFLEIQNTPLIIKDYLSNNSFLLPFFNREFSLENIYKQAEIKKEKYPYRKILAQELENQMNTLDLSENQSINLSKLKENTTFTITTGHQLNLMGGPLYFIYKILNTIKLCDILNASSNKDFYFVPVYWMATEDHDFEEINHFYFENQKIEWKGDFNDYSGEIPLDSLKEYLMPFYEKLSYYPKGEELKNLIKKSYFQKNNLAEATREFVHGIFKNYGLLILDANKPNLKQLFAPIIKEELEKNISYQYVNKTNQELKKKYKIQVNPREINLFYHYKSGRYRIQKEREGFIIIDTPLRFTHNELIEKLDKNPEEFSPNALLRPVYQELILPNVAYVGGNAEISYWLELKNYFDHLKISYPILIPRNSFLILNMNNCRKLDKWNLELSELFLPIDYLRNKIADKFSPIYIDFESYRNRLEKIFVDLFIESRSKKIPITWENMLKAQYDKQMKGFKKVEERMRRAKRKESEEIINNFERWYYKAFPGGEWQERKENFSFYYLLKGQGLLDLIYKNISEETNFSIIEF